MIKFPSPMGGVGCPARVLAVNWHAGGAAGAPPDPPPADLAAVALLPPPSPPVPAIAGFLDPYISCWTRP